MSRRRRAKPAHSPAGGVIKMLLICWTIFCAVWVLFSFFLGTLRGKEPGEEAAYACMSIFGSATGLVAWFVGVVPLGILFAVFGQPRRHDYAEDDLPPIRRRRRR